ncbi:hypothetical protein [Aquiflexum sp.]|uniref:hypothetical protein n=1 Tax=Aquiflexum sp. TaxID=1872584 RepID=UPI003593DAFE
MELDVFFEKLNSEDEISFKESVVEIIKIIGTNITEYEGVEEELLVSIKSGKYATMFDILWDVMMMELRFRINHLGLEAFNQGNGMGYILGTKKDLENLPLNNKLIDIASNMDALFPSQEIALRAMQNQVGMLKGKFQGDLNMQLWLELEEFLESFITFFDSAALESWTIGERVLFLVLNSDVEDLYPILNVKFELLKEDELEEVAEKIFIGYLDEDITLGQEACIDLCFTSVWRLLPEKSLTRLTDKINESLKGCTEYELVAAIRLLRMVGALDYLSGRNIVKLLESHFSDLAEDYPFDTPHMTIRLILDLKFFGVAYLPKARYKVAARVFLNFYMGYANNPEGEGKEDIEEAVHFIPELLGGCKLEFLECFNIKLGKLEAKESKKSNKGGFEMLHDLRRAINRRKDIGGEG